MRFRVGIIDLAAALVVLLAIFLPERQVTVESAYARYAKEPLDDELVEIARLQAELQANPGSGAAADELGRRLAQLGQHDMALRVGGEAATHGGPDQWRAWLAVSSAHADRIEIDRADAYAERALQACRKPGAACEDYQEIRLQLYYEQLEAGVKALATGIDPRLEPERFRRKVEEIHPTATIHPVRVKGGDH